MNQTTETYNNIIDELKADVFALSYLGAIDRNLLSLIAKSIEEKAASTIPSATKKLFKVFIELAQNIALYSAERSPTTDSENSGEGIIIFKEFNSYFQIYTGNMAFKQDIEALKEKIDKINQMSRDELREYKRKMRKSPNPDMGRGNIGLIQVALVSRNPIEYNILKLDNDKYFAIISSKIDKI
jgi:hypothetical protein